jgi:hypothetical protein
MLAMMTSAAAVAWLAVVTQNQAPLRAAAKESAPQQAVLWQGDSLEIRGEKLDYLQVYDHRRERAGYIKASQVRRVGLTPGDAPELLSVVRFLRDTTGAEALGISYMAAFLKAAPADAITAEAFDALGGMAERLAQRASLPLGKQSASEVAAQMEVVANYGVTIKSYERDGRIQLCYDGEAFRRVLAMTATAQQRANAALALTRPECMDPALRADQRDELDLWRADVLERVDPLNLPEHVRNRLRMRRAAVWSGIAFERARKNLPTQEAAERALAELAAIHKSEMTEQDGATYNDAAIRVGAARWAAVPVPVASPRTDAGLRIVTAPGQAGETCVSLVDAKHDQQHPLVSKCTYGIVWRASASSNARGTALALAVQPMASWREMWLFHQSGKEWRVDVMPPASSDPELGYAEFAGWVPGTASMLVAREARIDGRFLRRFEVVKTESLEVERWAEQASSLNLFNRWQNPAWKRETVSLR